MEFKRIRRVPDEDGPYRCKYFRLACIERCRDWEVVVELFGHLSKYNVWWDQPYEVEV
jgi:hypothetical protein